jgi:Ribbon-helix-helix protein, copG family
MRVNARLDEATQQQLDYLTQVTGQSVSHVLRESVAQYYVQVKGQHQPSRFLALAMSGKWRSGRSDISTNVRAAVLEALKAKYPQHFGDERAPAAPTKKTAAAAPKRRAA